MRELHVVATSEDGRHVVLATRKGAASGEYRVALDDRLAAAVRGDLPRPGESEPVVVTPKEIQARLRAGESPEEIAASAGVPVTKIERYAGPVLSERERVLDQARKGVVSRSRLGESVLPLGEAVDRHLADTVGVRLETVTWSARREEAGTWLVELSYVSQARRRSAVWRYDISRREVTATDSLSAALAHVEPGRRSRAVDHAAATPAPAARTTRPRRSAPARPAKAAAARTVAARPPVRAAAPVPRAAAAGKAAQTAADKAAAARAARAEAARVAAKERSAKAAAEQAARAAAEAEALAAEQARAAEQRAAQQAAERKAKADAARRAKAAADKKAKAEAERKAKAAAEKKKAQAAAEKKARADKAKADRAAAANAEKKAQAEAARKAKAAEAASAAEVAKAAEAARIAEDVPPGPPTLRVVGSDVAPAPRGPKEPPAAARTAPARVAGQRASVPGWADVLLSTAPVARPSEPDPDED